MRVSAVPFSPRRLLSLALSPSLCLSFSFYINYHCLLVFQIIAFVCHKMPRKFHSKSHRVFSIEVMPMDGGSAEVGRSEDEPTQLMPFLHARRPPEKIQRQFFHGDGLLEEDELMDLQELGSLSDGDLCMGRQLSASMPTADERGASAPAKNTPGTEEPKCAELQQRHEAEQQNMADDCLGGLVDSEVKAEFLPTEAVEQFLLGMNGNGSEETEEMAMAKEMPLGEQSRPKPKKPKRASSSENRAAAPSPSAEFAAPPPPPIVISPQEVDNISITLEKNQQCACRDCGKLFNSVWYLKQHAVKHSNDRPFKCRFCMKTYKFRSNLYQHKCPERNRLLLAGEFSLVGHPYRRRAYNRSSEKRIGTNNNSSNALLSSSISINTSPTNADNYVPNMSTLFPMEENGPGLLMVGGTNTPMGQQEQTTGDSSSSQQQQSLGLNGDCSLAPVPPRVLSPVGDTLPRNGQPSADCASPSFGCPLLHQSSSIQLAAAATATRERELPIGMLEEYMRRNRHRVFNCRKCKLYFPSREYFSRHIAYHDEMEEHKYCCEKCPERFQSEVALQAHQLQHAEQSPHCCAICNGIFRSALALRRHKDNWRQCHSPSFGIQFSLAVNPIDQYSFVESDLDEVDFMTERSEAEDEQVGEGDQEEMCAENGTLSRKTTRDSGYQGGSDAYSPSTGKQSPPIAFESDEQQLNNVHDSRSDHHGQFVTLINGKGQKPKNGSGGKRKYSSKGNESGNGTAGQREGGESRADNAMDRNNNNQPLQQQQQWTSTATTTDESPNIFHLKC